ncbi:MAG: TRAM domain-containing protein [Desulfurococcaceae archaeon TW002]
MTKYRNYSDPYSVNVQRFSIYYDKNIKSRMPQVGDELVVKIVEVDEEGRGVGYYNDFKVVISRAVLGEKVRVVVKKIENKVLHASVIERFGISRK